MPDLIGQHLGQYVITGLLGHGGMATVYRAYQESVKRDVAVKVIEARLAKMTDFVRRFEREAQTIALLSHPHILKMFDYGQYEDLVYLVMELITGGSLAAVIHQGALPLTSVSQILDQMASALDYAHQRGIIHRDLKPQNVLLDENGNALLTDFGIAKILGETTVLTQAGMAMGTPAYMAPEQWRGEPVDARTDIYALGVILFEMLTGRLPYLAETPYSMMHMHIHETLPPIRTIRPELPVGVERVVNKALAKNREQRFDSAAEVSEALNAAIAGNPLSELEIAARPEPPPTFVEVTPSPVPVPAQGVTATPVHGAPSAPQPRSRRNFLVGIVLGILGGVVVLALVVGLVLILPNLQNAQATAPPAPASTQVAAQAASPTDTATAPPISPSATIPAVAITVSPSATSSPTLPTDTPMETPTPKPNVETRAAATIAQRATLTAIIVASFSKTPTPNEQETLAAIVAGTETAMALTAAAQMPTLTLMPTDTPTEVPTEMPTEVPTETPTEVPTDTPTEIPTWTPMPLPTITPYRPPIVSGQIAFTLNSGSGWQIYVINPNGSGMRAVTNRGDNGVYGIAWSPGWDRLAFESNRDGNEEIYTASVNGSNLRRLTYNAVVDRAPSWSPDGSQIAFESRRDGPSRIYLMNADGSNQRALTGGQGNDYAPAWSADGQQIVFFSDRTGNAELNVINANGSGRTSLTRDSAYDNYSPHWSPDGSRITFFRRPSGGGKWQIYVMDADGSNMQALTDDDSNNVSPDWSPDSNQIVFVSDRNGKSNLYVMDADGSNLRSLTNVSGIAGSPNW